MIIGIGTDLIKISRIQKVLSRFPKGFPQRLLTARERETYRATSVPERFLAKRFAAKEACLKALGTGMIQGLSWQDMEIDHLKTGQPVLALSGGARRILEERVRGSLFQIDLSLSDEEDLALAFVVISL